MFDSGRNSNNEGICGAYQKHATTLAKMTLSCSGTYKWFTHPTTGQNCTFVNNRVVIHIRTEQKKDLGEGEYN